MCNAAKAMEQHEVGIRAVVYAYPESLQMTEAARLAQIALDLQKMRFAHEERCVYCEAERVSQALSEVA